MYHDHDTIAAPATAAGGAIAVIRISGPDALTVCGRIFRGKTPLTEAPGHSIHYGRIVDGGQTENDRQIADSRRTVNDGQTENDGQIADDRRIVNDRQIGDDRRIVNDGQIADDRRIVNDRQIGDGRRTVDSGQIADGGRIVDDVLVTIFRAPRSYTGQDSAEISCHGSRYIVSEILRLLIRAGARMAEPGEFTTRAFLAGKMDLSQAEAVADLIASSSRAAHAVASTQMRGGVSNALGVLRAQLVRLTSLLELELDFSEEDVEFADRTQLRQNMQQIATEIEALRASFTLGNALKQGVAVAIVGEPNVGKSTLLNRLLGEERAMVSDIAGTTRDAIEETADIDGVLFRFIDTAGIRATDDTLEQMGIERSLAAVERARIVIRMTDASNPAVFLPAFTLRPDQRMIDVVNKIDKIPGAPLPEHAIAISAREAIGIDTLRKALRDTTDTASVYHGDAVVSSARHYEALTAAREALTLALQALDNGRTADLLSEHIREVLHHLGTITGEISSEEVLQSIFTKFCIGK